MLPRILLTASCAMPGAGLCVPGGAQRLASHLTHASNKEVQLHNIPSDLLASKAPKISSAVFIKSSMDMERMPAATGPEIAFIGHSNVGKSSLLNVITGSEGLAKVSKQPGKTRCINHFLINRKFYLVDCPGYGYARVSKQERETLHQLTQEFLSTRATLAHVFLLVDATMRPQAMDIDAAMWLNDNCVSPWSLIFTKADACGELEAGKQRPPSRASSSSAWWAEEETKVIQCHPHPKLESDCESVQHIVQTVVRAMKAVSADTGAHHGGPSAGYPHYILTSSKTGLGRETVLQYLWQLQSNFDVPLVFK